jgi:glycosyltransferase involved in cell wall biosynthesis
VTARRIALVVGQLQMGGAERQLFELAVRLDRAKYAPFVVCLSQVAEPFATRLRERGVDVEVIARRGHRDPGRAWRLARILRQRDAHLAHSFLLAANAYTWTASSFPWPSRPYIASSRTCIPARGWFARQVHTLAFRSARRVIANSRRVMEFTRDTYGLDAGRIRVIPNGVDLAGVAQDMPAARAAAGAALKLPPDAVVVGGVGRLSTEKNPHLFVELAARVTRGRQRVLFVLVGDGPAMRDLRALVVSLGLGDRLLLPGAREDVSRLLPAFDVFVSTSNTEGMPNAVMEAMAAGLPVVATRVGGTEEVVEEGETGFLVEAGDLGALADRTGRLLDDEDLRRRLGHRGRSRIESGFPVEKMVAATAALYDEALS